MKLGERKRRIRREWEESRLPGVPETTTPNRRHAAVLALQAASGNRTVARSLAPGGHEPARTQPAAGTGRDPYGDFRAGFDGRGLDKDAEEGTDERFFDDLEGESAPGGVDFAIPIAVRNGPGHTPIDEDDVAGMSIDITLTSSSGNDNDMANVQDSEQVSKSLNHTGSYKSIPEANSNNSGYMPGYPIPADQHTEPKDRIIDLADNHDGNGSMERQQLDSFKAEAAGIGERVIPHSGYVIRRSIAKTGNQIKFTLEKCPQACSVNGFSTEAGPSPRQSEEVVVRPA
jgi:hypothetical protein